MQHLRKPPLSRFSFSLCNTTNSQQFTMAAPPMIGKLPTGGKLAATFVAGVFVWLYTNNYHTERIIESKYRKDKFHLHRIQQAIYKDLIDDLYEKTFVPATLNAEKVEDICMRRSEQDVERCKNFFTEYYEIMVQAAMASDPTAIQQIDKVDFFAREPYLKTIGRGTYGREIMEAAYSDAPAAAAADDVVEEA